MIGRSSCADGGTAFKESPKKTATSFFKDNSKSSEKTTGMDAKFHAERFESNDEIRKAANPTDPDPSSIRQFESQIFEVCRAISTEIELISDELECLNSADSTTGTDVEHTIKQELIERLSQIESQFASRLDSYSRECNQELQNPDGTGTSCAVGRLSPYLYGCHVVPIFAEIGRIRSALIPHPESSS